jgi:uncharacterized protein YacL (UPF0231 family)
MKNKKQEIKQLKENIIFDIDRIMETLIHDYDLSKLSFCKTDIILSHKILKRKIKKKFKRLEDDKLAK